jgi:hypothetical protein
LDQLKGKIPFFSITEIRSYLLGRCYTINMWVIGKVFFAPITNIVGCHWPFQKWNDNITTYVNKLNKVKLSLKKKLC